MQLNSLLREIVLKASKTLIATTHLIEYFESVFFIACS